MTPKKPDKPKEPTSVTMAATAKPETPKAATTPTTQPQPPTANKQQATVAKLKAAWAEKGISLKELVEKQDGKFILLQPTPDWPIVRVGPTGGIELPQIRSYAKALDAALDGLATWQKQQARDQKKASSAISTPAPAQAAKPQPAPAAKPDTVTARKQKEHRSLEAALA